MELLFAGNYPFVREVVLAFSSLGDYNKKYVIFSILHGQNGKRKESAYEIF